MLSQEQLTQYDRDGYVLVSGLIPEETIANAEAAMWSVLGVDRDDPASWSPLPDETDGVKTIVSQGVIEHFGVQDPALLACCTPAFYEVQSQLARENAGAFHCQESGHAVYFRFRKTGIIAMGTSMVGIDLSMSFPGHSASLL